MNIGCLGRDEVKLIHVLGRKREDLILDIFGRRVTLTGKRTMLTCMHTSIEIGTVFALISVVFNVQTPLIKVASRDFGDFRTSWPIRGLN